MSILNKATVLVLNRNWQAINIRTPAEAFCQMATGVATALEIEVEAEDASESENPGVPAPHSALRTSAIRPVTWAEWLTLTIREQDQAVKTVRGDIRVPTVIVLATFAKVPKKRPKLCARTIRERDGHRCQYTGTVLRPEDGNIDHVVPRSRGGKDAWENCVWSSKAVNSKKGNRLPHEAGLKLLKQPVAVREMPVSALIQNTHGIPDWEPFVNKAKP